MRSARRARWIAVLGGLVAAAAIGSSSAQIQTEYTNNFKFNAGQSVQPVFEGWSRAADGRVSMHFGYLNRNWVERPHVPVGPDNQIEPGGPDWGQPTYFYNRTHRNLFTVNVPADWGRTQELVWTVTVNGKTERAVGWLQPEWEIDPVGGAQQGGRTDEEYVRNAPPAITIAPVPAARRLSPVTLTTTVADDGLPIPRGRRKPAVGQETPPTLRGGTDAPVNVPALAPPPSVERPQGLSVSWIVWRGPADVAFDPAYAVPADGGTSTTARFARPGEYVLRATANDGSKVGHAQVPVMVAGAESAGR